jgi:hypothetical protein
MEAIDVVVPDPDPRAMSSSSTTGGQRRYPHESAHALTDPCRARFEDELEAGVWRGRWRGQRPVQARSIRVLVMRARREYR